MVLIRSYFKVLRTLMSMRVILKQDDVVGPIKSISSSIRMRCPWNSKRLPRCSLWCGDSTNWCSHWSSLTKRGTPGTLVSSNGYGLLILKIHPSWNIYRENQMHRKISTNKDIKISGGKLVVVVVITKSYKSWNLDKKSRG